MRDTRFVCLPCQPRPAASASGFSISEPLASMKNLHVTARAPLHVTGELPGSIFAFSTS